MSSKYPVRWPCGGVDVQVNNPIPDGRYAKALDAIYQNLQNGSGRPPSDARMDFCACNLAHAMKNIKT